jgi:nicotinate phosphoribosyltransferase
MLTDTFTVKTFFDDFTSDPARALRWGALRHDSGDPFEFIKMAKKAWTTVENKAGIKREGSGGKGRIAEGKMAVFSDSLDVKKALQIQAMCDKEGMAGESRVFCYFSLS